MASVLETVAFDPAAFRAELAAFKALLDSKPDLGERDDIQPFFKTRQHLTAALGGLALPVAVATELCFEFDLAGDFRADILLGNRRAGQFCAVEFEDGRGGTLFKRQKRKHPEWSSRFEHAFSQVVDWFFSFEDQRNSAGFQATFGSGEVAFSALVIMGRDRDLSPHQARRLAWRAKKVLIDSNKVLCLTFDQLYISLNEKLELYAAAAPKAKASPEPAADLPPS